MSLSRPSTPPIRPLSASCPRKTALNEGIRAVRDHRPRSRPRREVRNVVAVISNGDTGALSGAVLGIPVSAGALIFDRAGRLLILKPTYKSGWTIPGGVMEADGETPWEA